VVAAVSHGSAEMDDGFSPAEHEVLALSSAGRVDEAADLLETLPPGPFASVARLDLLVRAGASDREEITRVADAVDVHRPRGRELSAWARALLAERLLMDFDGACVGEAEKALADLPGEGADPPRLLVFARARLRRVLLARHLFEPSGHDVHRWPVDLAGVLEDLQRCGFADEAVLTTVLVTAMDQCFAGADSDAAIDRVRRARLLLDDVRSLWPMLIDHTLLLMCAVAGDQALLRQTWARLARYTRVPDAYRMIRMMAEHLIVRDWSEDDIFHRWRTGLHGSTGPEPGVLPSTGGPPVGDPERELHLLSYRVRAGRVPAVHDLVDTLDRVARHGLHQGVTRFARQLADDLVAAGAREAAAAVDGWLAAAGQSAAVPASVEPPVGRDAPAAGVGIHVLRPVLEVLVDGRPVPISDAAAGLLVALAVAAPTPVHVEQLGEILWPGATARTARPRLNALVHRLRTRHPAVGQLVVRAGSTVALDTERCEIDLLRYRAALGHGAAERLRALASVRGNLCHVQFPYDEHLIEERHRLAAEWQARAQEATDADPGARQALESARRSLGL
jgi:hypothetical protein